MSIVLAITAVVTPVMAPASDIVLPQSWKVCRQDQDCAAIIRCGSCCADDAINKTKIEDYNNLYAQECQTPRRLLCPCAFHKPICTKGVCELKPPLLRR